MEKIGLNDHWSFIRFPGRSIEDADILLSDLNTAAARILTAETCVQLPHSFFQEDEPYRGLAVYRKQILDRRAWKQLYLSVPAADREACVYVNGIKIGEHKGGYGAFHLYISEKARKAKEGILDIVIFVSNEASDHISPLSGDFTVFGGLYRGVYLLHCQETHFDYGFYGTDGVLVRTKLTGQNQGMVQIDTHVINGNADTKVVYYLIDQQGQCIATEVGRPGLLVLKISDVKPWRGIEDPFLYTFRTELWQSSQCTDVSEKQIGFRDIQIDAAEGLYLNGKRLKLRGVAKHQDREQRYHAVTEQDIAEDFALIKEIGANALRLSHYQHPETSYAYADQMGLLVWAEIPLLKMTEDALLYVNAEIQLRELILQNLHHCSIFCWGIQNEIGMFWDAPYMYERLKKLHKLCKLLDPDRMTTAANLFSVKAKSGLNEQTDLIGYNLYFGWYYGKMNDYEMFLQSLHEKRPSLPLCVSEYGVDANPELHSEMPMVQDYSEEYQALYHETVYPIISRQTFLFGSFVWNMFDFSSALRKEGGVTGRNQKGLVSYDRRYKKDAFYYYKAQWSDVPFLHICSKGFRKRALSHIDIKVYTNQAEIELYRGGELLGKTGVQNGAAIMYAVPLHEGENSFIVKSGELQDSVTFIRVFEEEASYRLKDDAAGKMVRNWFLSKDTPVKEGFYSMEDSLEDLLTNTDTRRILQQFLPKLYEDLESNENIPRSLSLRSILKRDGAADADLKTMNQRLNEIPVEE